LSAAASDTKLSGKQEEAPERWQQTMLHDSERSSGDYINAQQRLVSAWAEGCLDDVKKLLFCLCFFHCVAQLMAII
jgi:hypothetical protein